MRINFPGGPTAAALEESDMGCLGGALLIDTNNNTNDNGDNSQVWIFRNQLYPRGMWRVYSPFTRSPNYLW